MEAELLPRLPPFGMTAGGLLFQQAPPERLTNGPDGSASPTMPTPTARDWKDTGDNTNYRWWLDRGKGMPLPAAVALLPTPTAQDGANNAGPSQWERNSKPLNVIAVELTLGLTGERSNDGSESLDDPPPTPPTTGGTCRPGSSSG